ncbi:MAG TPA: DUF4331 family protein [Ktedonobacterales bacterium]|nr:DUF4331 family protein [Ktedonobacterales bacterium]
MSSHRETAASTLLSSASLLAAYHMPGSALLAEEPRLPEGVDPESLHVNLNITDLYVFQKPGNPDKSILIMNVNPMPPRLSAAFDATASYDFLIDTNNDALADIAFRVTFSPLANGQQTATVRRAAGADAAGKEIAGDIIIQNAPVSFGSQAQITPAGDYVFFAGLRGDPFFFDLMGFCNNLKFTGTDYFSDKDVFSIVLEAPNAALGPQPKIGVWARVIFPHDGDLLQIARLGFPLLNILFNAGEDKFVFLETDPARHRTIFLDKFAAVLQEFGHTADQAQQLAQQFLPDILPYDYSSAAGFFNGRGLRDDVADTLLKLVTNGQATSDHAGPHPYLTAFPYLEAPHGRYQS